MNFSISNYENQCNALIIQASQKAQKRADSIAKSLSADIDGIRSLDSHCSANNYNSSRLYMAKNMDSGDILAQDSLPILDSDNSSFRG